MQPATEFPCNMLPECLLFRLTIKYYVNSNLILLFGVYFEKPLTRGQKWDLMVPK